MISNILPSIQTTKESRQTNKSWPGPVIVIEANSQTSSRLVQAMTINLSLIII
jgi:hypothetical protein